MRHFTTTMGVGGLNDFMLYADFYIQIKVSRVSEKVTMHEGEHTQFYTFKQ